MVEIKPFKNQDYALLKSQHNASNLFVDPEFPANSKSLYLPKTPTTVDLQWKRPKVSRKIDNCSAFDYHWLINLYCSRKFFQILNLLWMVLKEVI